jgi:hypothetical protein
MKERPWFQFHLSTLIVLQFLVAVFMFLDFKIYAVSGGSESGLVCFVLFQLWTLIVVAMTAESAIREREHSKALRKPFTEDERREIHEHQERRKAAAQQEPPSHKEGS